MEINMNHQCCSKELVRFEIESYYKDLKKSETLRIEITKCPTLEGSFDLKIIKEKLI